MGEDDKEEGRTPYIILVMSHEGAVVDKYLLCTTV